MDSWYAVFIGRDNSVDDVFREAVMEKVSLRIMKRVETCLFGWRLFPI